MTEDEAKTKMCCGPQTVAMAIVITAPRGTVEVLPEAGRCIGSACMAWRVSVTPSFQENIYNRKEKPEGDGWKPFTPYADNHAWHRLVPEKREGHCGLAGKPQ